MSVNDRIRIKDIRLLSDNWYVLKTTTFDWLHSNGEWQTQHRETYDRGNGATLLPIISNNGPCCSSSSSVIRPTLTVMTTC